MTKFSLSNTSEKKMNLSPEKRFIFQMDNFESSVEEICSCFGYERRASSFEGRWGKSFESLLCYQTFFPSTGVHPGILSVVYIDRYNFHHPNWRINTELELVKKMGEFAYLVYHHRRSPRIFQHKGEWVEIQYHYFIFDDYKTTSTNLKSIEQHIEPKYNECLGDFLKFQTFLEYIQVKITAYQPIATKVSVQAKEEAFSNALESKPHFLAIGYKLMIGIYLLLSVVLLGIFKHVWPLVVLWDGWMLIYILPHLFWSIRRVFLHHISLSRYIYLQGIDNLSKKWKSRMITSLTNQEHQERLKIEFDL